jgi:hypothetical protein
VRTRVSFAVGVVAGAVLLLSSHRARAQVVPAPGRVTAPGPAGRREAPGPPPLTRGFDRSRIGIGYRATFVRDPTFDTFARNGLLSQLSLEGTYAFVSAGRFAVATGLTWDFGSLRGLFDDYDVSLQVHRFTVPVEARVSLTPWLYGFGRAAPGFALHQARVNNLGAPLQGGPWAPAVDVSGGVAILLAPRSAERTDVARVWLTPEVGYGFAGERSLGPLQSRRGPVLDGGAPANLGALAVRGPFVRATVGLTF